MQSATGLATTAARATYRGHHSSSSDSIMAALTAGISRASAIYWVTAHGIWVGGSASRRGDAGSGGPSVEGLVARRRAAQSVIQVSDAHHRKLGVFGEVDQEPRQRD